MRLHGRKSTDTKSAPKGERTRKGGRRRIRTGGKDRGARLQDEGAGVVTPARGDR
jgi:hypothetical protein